MADLSAPGRLDARLIGPGASNGERVLCYGAAFAGVALSVAVAVAHGRLSALAILVIAAVALDLYGGAVVNATATAKRWWHRPGRTARHHLTFVVCHVQPFLLALVVPGFGWAAAGASYAVVVVSAAVVLTVPTRLRRPAAFATAVLALTAVTALTAVPAELSWFLPVLLIKLLLAHLLFEKE
ncbi:hypothetical protein F4561_005288 [Lipingzhangella halophila]|uniref:Uncharacterized protein n=1 Tax=Lipingzhangella halophila TaxID=1783352 RepID=A0A7W7W594_9ACTN|nr:hypothetical protein [Lipingzhangella halophila]MBB4934468.1 hypothetical protein [Lipingzhangella halophila]